MKNKLPLFIVIVVVIAAVAGYLIMNRTGRMNSPEDIVANALSGNGSVKCEYDEDGRHIVAYIKGSMMRTDITGGEEGSMSMIYKDNTSWTWNPDTKEGMMFTAPEITPMEGEEVVTEEEVNVAMPDDTEAMKAEIEKYKDSCKSESIADSLFEAPSDITFMDYSQMMEQQMQNLPAEYQQYMQQ